MIFLIAIFFMLMFISFMLLSMNFLFNKKKMFQREKMSPFECGFDPLNNSRLPFSIQFYMISLMFLIFDIEITLLIPSIFISMNMFIHKYLILSLMFFLLILLFGMYIEYSESSIDWIY